MANIGEKSAFHLGEIIPAFDQTTLVLPIKKKNMEINARLTKNGRKLPGSLRSLCVSCSITVSRDQDKPNKKIEKPKNDVRNGSNKPNPRKQRQEKDAKFKYPSISERRRIVGNIAIEEFQKEIDRNKRRRRKDRIFFLP